MTITAQQRRLIRARAGDCCEYCRMPESAGTVTFHVDHIRPVQHGGRDDADNLCLACFLCNNFKGYNPGGFDPATEGLTRLYHPRGQHWHDHFQLETDFRISGLTPEGRTTVVVLHFNDTERIQQRDFLFQVGIYPCDDRE